MTPGQLRRRAARVERRRTDGVARQGPAPIKLALPAPAWNEAHIQHRLAELWQFLSPVYGGRYIRNRANALREHLIAVAKAARIERCTFQRVVKDEKGHVRTGDACGGRIRQRRIVENGRRAVERFCDRCGRESFA